MKTNCMPRECCLKLQSIYISLNKSEKRIADILMNGTLAVPATTIKNLAAEAECSEATVVRFAKKLGYDGYLDMRRKFADYINNPPVLQYDDMKLEDPVESIIKKVYETTVQSLEDTYNFLELDKINNAAEIIAGANKILVAGVGDGAVTADAAYHKFVRIGLQCFTSTDIDMQLILCSQMNPDTDVLIIISHSGLTKSLLNLAKAAKKYRIPMIVITNYETSPLALEADIILQGYSFTTDTNGEVISKRITQFFIIEILYICTLKILGHHNVEILTNSNTAVKPNKA